MAGHDPEGRPRSVAPPPVRLRRATGYRAGFRSGPARSSGTPGRGELTDFRSNTHTFNTHDHPESATARAGGRRILRRRRPTQRAILQLLVDVTSGSMVELR